MSDASAETVETIEAAEEKTITRGQSLTMLGSSMVVAVAALLCQILAVKVLGPVVNGEFVTFWSVFFGLIGVVAGIQQETTRAVGAQNLVDRGASGVEGSSPRSGARAIPVAMAIGAVFAVLIAVSSPLWAGSVLHLGTGGAILLITVGTFLASVNFAVSGASAGLNRWYSYAALGGGEGVLRFLAMVVLGLGVGSLFGLEAAVITGSAAWILLALGTRTVRSTMAARTDVGTGRLVRNILIAMGSSASSAVLMIGFPALMNASEGGRLSPHQMLVIGGLGVAISVTRSPIMIPLQAFQGVFISSFLKQRAHPIRAVLRPGGVMLGIGAVGAVLAWLIGPFLFGLLFDRKYLEVIDGPILALLVFASAVLAMLVLTGAAALALDIHTTFILGWVVAAVVGVGLLFALPMPLAPRAIIALYAGPACGFAVHLSGMVSASRKAVARA